MTYNDISSPTFLHRVTGMASPSQRCLIIDENFLVGLDLEEILRSLDIGDVDRAKDFAQAISLLESMPYNLVFLDIEVGSDKVERIASIAAAHGAKCIFTATDPDRNQHSSLHNATQSFITKPYSPAKIKGILKSMGTEFAPGRPSDPRPAR